MSTTRIDRHTGRRLGSRDVVALVSMPCFAFAGWFTASAPPIVGVAACVVTIALSPSWRPWVRVLACALVSTTAIAATISGPPQFHVICLDMEGSCTSDRASQDIVEMLAGAVFLVPVIALVLAVLARRRSSGIYAEMVVLYQDGAIAVMLGAALTVPWWVDGFDDVGPFVALPIGVVLATLIVFALQRDAWPGARKVAIMVSLMAWAVVQTLYVSQLRYECADPADSSVVLRGPCDTYPGTTPIARGVSLSIAVGVSGYLVYVTARRQRTLAV